MEWTEIVSAVGSVGICGVMCFALLGFMKDQIAKLTDAVNNNTVVMSRLLERMGNDDR